MLGLSLGIPGDNTDPTEQPEETRSMEEQGGGVIDSGYMPWVYSGRNSAKSILENPDRKE
jgi:hypothetical protein